MSFALEGSASLSSSLPPSRPSRGGGAVVAVPKKLAMPTVTAATVSMNTQGRRATPPSVPAAVSVPVANRRSLSVAQTLSRVRDQGKTAFIPYITAGDPDLVTTAAALRLLDACGADVIELGMPSSDPYVDGPVIRASAARALAGGATVDLVLSMLKEVTPELSCPVVLLSYLSPIVRRGAGSFAAAVKESGVQGLIVPDLPYGGACAFRHEATKNDLELVLLTTPATPTDRMKKITKASKGFIYLVSVIGVTGPRETVNLGVKDLIEEIKQVTDKAVAVGFGISTPDHVRQIAEWGADAVIIGSAMVKQLGEVDSPIEGLKRLEEFARNLKGALP